MSLDTFAIMIVLCIPGFLSSLYEAQSQTSLVNSTEVLYSSDKVECFCKVEYTKRVAWSLEASEVLITFLFFPVFHSQGETQVDILQSYTITAVLTSVRNSSIVTILTLPLAPALNDAIIKCNGMTLDYGKNFWTTHSNYNTSKDITSFFVRQLFYSFISLNTGS